LLVIGWSLLRGIQLTGRWGRWTAVRGSGQDGGRADNFRYSWYARCLSGRAPVELWAIKNRGILYSDIHKCHNESVLIIMPSKWLRWWLWWWWPRRSSSPTS